MPRASFPDLVYQPEKLISLRNSQTIESFMCWLELLYQCYFRVTSYGWEHIPSSGKVLIVGSHNGGLASPDTYMFAYDWWRRFGTQRPAYALMIREAFRSKRVADRAVQIGAVPAEPRVATTALRQGAAVLVYPGGGEDVFRPYSQRHRIHLAGHKGFIKLALRENVLLVPVVSTGAHETLIVLSDCHEVVEQLEQWGLIKSLPAMGKIFPIYLGLPWGLACGFVPNIPLPVQIHLRVCPPIVFDCYGKKAAKDRQYVDACYQKVLIHMQHCLDELVASTSRKRKSG